MHVNAVGSVIMSVCLLMSDTVAPKRAREPPLSDFARRFLAAKREADEESRACGTGRRGNFLLQQVCLSVIESLIISGERCWRCCFFCGRVKLRENRWGKDSGRMDWSEEGCAEVISLCR